MIQEKCSGYLIKANPVEVRSGSWAVSTIIEKIVEGKRQTKCFYADDNIHYILEIEAAKECLNLGKNLINSHLVGF